MKTSMNDIQKTRGKPLGGLVVSYVAETSACRDGILILLLRLPFIVRTLAPFEPLRQLAYQPRHCQAGWSVP